jgi:pilus assembly protein Flp/PilA
MVGFIVDFLDNECAATAIEYALIAGSIALAIVIAVQQIGTSLSGIFATVTSGVNS